jgi:TonB family protein
MSIRTARDGQPTGVWELEALQAAVDRGDVLPADLIWTIGFQNWKQLSVVAREIGISLPVLEDVPPIPGTAAQVPPIPSAPPNIESSAGTASAHDLGELTFRKRSDRKSYGFSASTKIIFVLLLLGGGWLFATRGLPWVKARLQANSAPAIVTAGSSASDQSPHSSFAKIDASPAGLDGFIQSLRGRYVRLHEPDSTTSVSIYLDEDGFLHHCPRKTLKECLKQDSELSLAQEPLTTVTSTDLTSSGVWCQQGGRESMFVNVSSICVSDKDRDLEPFSISDDPRLQSKKLHVPAGVPFYVFTMYSRRMEGTESKVYPGSKVKPVMEMRANWLFRESGKSSQGDRVKTDPTPSNDAFARAAPPEKEPSLDCLLRTQKLREYESAAQSGNAVAAAMAKGIRGLKEAACNSTATEPSSASVATDATRSPRCPVPNVLNASPEACVSGPPSYPPEEQRRGIQGTTVLVASVDEAGVVADVQVEQSSGNRNLDREAIKTVGNWYYSPAVSGGKPVASRVRVPVDFSLPDNASGSTNAGGVSGQVASQSELEPNDKSSAGFVVQVGAFATAAAATSLRDSLRGAGFIAFTDTVSTNDGMRIRVRVGPVSSRADADALNAAIKAKIGLEGAVRPHP